MTPKKSKLRVFILLGVVLVIVLLAGIKFSQFAAMGAAAKKMVIPPESTTSASVQKSEWPSTRAAIATLVAVHGVTLGADAAGAIREINFDSGAHVSRGQVLVKLDTSVEEAQLASALADAALAKVGYERAVVLRKGESNTQADVDAADAKAKQTTAAVENWRATIAKKTIRAPFDGRVAIRQVELGQIVSSGTPIATLQSVDPIYAEFSLPQQSLADIKIGQLVHMHTDTFPGANWDGKVSQINSEIDVSTRNVRMRATIPNADGRLRPGMFANIEVVSGAPQTLLTIPITSVLFAPYGDSVFVLKDDKDNAGQLIATQMFVHIGERRGDLVALAPDSKLIAGNVVASSGVFKLKNGTHVIVNNALAPDVQLAPTPVDK